MAPAACALAALLVLCCHLLALCVARPAPAPPSDTDYSFAVLSDLHIGESEEVRSLAVSAVAKINKIAQERDIRFVFITGDVSNTALDEQFEDAKSILDQLKPFYLPIIGNHDMWAYNNTSGWEEDVPTGDARFARTFAEQYTHPNVTYNNESCWNPNLNITSWFQNFELHYGRNVFYGLDWNTRLHAVRRLGYLGAMPGARLHHFDGGTFPWLQRRLEALPEAVADGGVVLLQHHPFHMPIFMPDAVYSFGHHEQGTLRDMISAAQPRDKYWGQIAGHTHLWNNGSSWPREWPSFWQWQTAACKRCAAISVVRVEASTIVHIDKVYGGAQRCLFKEEFSGRLGPR